ncbi:MAG: MATE family efflux transporter [Lachnospiraceae bacterium]|nr:MATE family efflux transporter [Lachnospiraceae bacterium]
MAAFRYPREDVKKAIGMAWPAVLESFFTAFAGLVDSLMVSSLGSSAVAAVGLTTQPKMVGLALFFAANVSISALVARRKGEGNKEGANGILATFLVFILGAAALISVLAVVFADPVIRLCGSETDTHGSAVQYFQIVMGGMVFNCVQMGVNAAQRGAGNTRITMRTNLVSNTINILLNYLLIQGHMGFPALGIRGAALATVFGTVVASFMSLWSIGKEENFVSLAYILKQKIRPGMEALRQIIHVGYSVFAEQLLMRIGFMMTSLMAASQGTFAMAAHQVGMNVMSLSFSFGDGLQATAVALIGYSLGAGDPPKAREYGAICRMLGGCVSLVLAVAYFFGGGWLYSLFFEETEIIAIGVQIMRIIIFVVLLQIAQVIYMGCLRGAGDTLYTAIASTVSVTVIRTAGSYIFGYVLGWGIAGIWMGVVADQLSRFLFASIRFKRGKWTEIKI